MAGDVVFVGSGVWVVRAAGPGVYRSSGGSVLAKVAQQMKSRTLTIANVNNLF